MAAIGELITAEDCNHYSRWGYFRTSGHTGSTNAGLATAGAQNPPVWLTKSSYVRVQEAYESVEGYGVRAKASVGYYGNDRNAPSKTELKNYENVEGYVDEVLSGEGWYIFDAAEERYDFMIPGENGSMQQISGYVYGDIEVTYAKKNVVGGKLYKWKNPTPEEWRNHTPCGFVPGQIITAEDVKDSLVCCI